MELVGWSAVALATAALAPRIARRLALSRAKQPGLAGHTRMAKRLTGWIPGYSYDDAQWFDADGADAAVAGRRRAALARLSGTYRQRFARSIALTAEARAGLSDLQLTAAYRVPFPFSALLRQHVPSGGFVASAGGVTVTDLDGNVFDDLTGSYGVNLFGHDFYKSCIAEGARRVEALGPVLGSYHPCVADNVRRLQALSGLDEVSFHMSGTEAVMQAVRLARYHTGRSHLVRFAGAYHGWWGDVQPGPGNPLAPHETYTLRDLHAQTLRVLDTRKDIACVLVNPLQALHPNRAAPGDSTLVDGSRKAGFDRAAYTAWLKQLREVCTRRGIVLIFDEVFLGFRLAPGGAQAYFGVQADIVTYGKTLGGGLPVGVVCGKRGLMKRFREDRPADLNFARGTFNAHPHVMGAMQVFLERLASPACQALYDGLDATWDRRAAALNQRLESAGLPVRVTNLSTVWTVLFTTVSRYHWMLPYYLRLEGLALSWVGSGRLIFTLAHTEADFTRIAERFERGCEAMRADGWWDAPAGLTAARIHRRLLREMLAERLRGLWPSSRHGGRLSGGAAPTPGRADAPAAAAAARGGTA